MFYKQLKINITKAQLDKALKGKPIQLSRTQLGEGNNYLSLHPANVKIVEKAVMKGSGCVINISPGELMATAEDMNGEGIFSDIWRGLKSGYKWVKKNVIDTPIYQSAIKPLVRQAVNAGVAAANVAYPGSSAALTPITNKIGEKTGAFGMKKRTKAQRNEMLKGKGLYMS